MSVLRGQIRVSIRYLVSPLISLVVFAPLIPNLVIMLREADLHASVVPAPTWFDLGTQWIPPRFAIALFLSMFALIILRGWNKFEVPLFSPPKEFQLFVVLCWAMLPGLFLFAYALLSHRGVFINRYLLGQAPGVALLFGALAASIGAPIWRTCFASVLAFIALTGGGLRLWNTHTPEDWRTAASLTTAWREQNPGAPILAASCFLESNALPMPVTSAQLVFLRTYLLPYSFPSNLGYLPIGLNLKNETQVLEIINNASTSRSFLLLTVSESNLNRWLEGYLAKDFTIRTLLANPRLIEVKHR